MGISHTLAFTNNKPARPITTPKHGPQEHGAQEHFNRQDIVILHNATTSKSAITGAGAIVTKPASAHGANQRNTAQMNDTHHD